MTLKQQAREEFFGIFLAYYEEGETYKNAEKYAEEEMTKMNNLIDRTIDACIAAVPEEYPDTLIEGRVEDKSGWAMRQWNECRTLTLERLNALRHE